MNRKNTIHSTIPDKDKPMFTSLKKSYHFLILFVLCVIFVCVKTPNLNIPFCWDEAWVYAPGIKVMAQNGISLLPHGLSDSYSRGHPLLFFFTGAAWVKLFGGGFTSLHIFALATGMSFIFTLFYVIKKVFDSTLALVVTSITLVQPNFIAQSAITVPEIFLSMWAILTIYHFVQKNRYYYFLFGTLMMLTKESGAVIIASLMLYQMICFLTKKITIQSLKLFMLNSLLASAPIIPFVVFLIVQHYQSGYYLFPGHLALLNFNWNDIQERLKQCYDILFEQQGRIYITWSFLLAFGLLYKPIPVIARWTIVLGLMVCVKIFFRYWYVPDWLMILIIVAFTAAFYYLMHIKNEVKHEEAAKFLAIVFIIGPLYLVFSSINFFTNRYLLILVPLMLLYFSYYIKDSFHFRYFLSYIWAALMVSLLLYNAVFQCKTTGDDSPNYLSGVKLEQMIIKYMEDQNLQNAKIYCKFSTEIALTNKGCGYLSGSRVFSNTSEILNDNAEYAIYTNIDKDTLFEHRNDTLPDFRIIKKLDYGIAHSRIFKRI